MLEAAAGLFAERGDARATINQIVKALLHPNSSGTQASVPFTRSLAAHSVRHRVAGGLRSGRSAGGAADGADHFFHQLVCRHYPSKKHIQRL
jgi:hypothetical protein